MRGSKHAVVSECFICFNTLMNFAYLFFFFKTTNPFVTLHGLIHTQKKLQLSVPNFTIYTITEQDTWFSRHYH